MNYGVYPTSDMSSVAFVVINSYEFSLLKFKHPRDLGIGQHN